MTDPTKTCMNAAPEPCANGDVTDAAGWFERVRKLVGSGTSVRFAPQGYSMWPGLSPGKDVVTLGEPTALKKGDIVLASCCAPELVVLHRVRALTPSGAVLMGDCNLYQTELCVYTRVAGKVIAIEPADWRASLRRSLSAKVQNLPPAPRRFIIRIFNLFRP